MRQIFTGKKSFEDPWIGHPMLNRLGLHPARIALSDGALLLRRAQVTKPGRHAMRALQRDGVAVLEQFLPSERFEPLQQEVRERFSQAEEKHPHSPALRKGFGPRQAFEGGHDHYDGGTFIRNIQIDHRTPRAMEFTNETRLARLLTFASGYVHEPARCRLYQTVHGHAPENPDIQTELHKDTFHSTIKFWFFLEDCTLDDGPFAYSLGSHRMTWRRYRWERERAIMASTGGDTMASFRVSEQELREMRCEPPRPLPVPANTLVIADTRGFHQRTPGRPGARRLAIHAVLRRQPFGLHPIP